MDLKWQNIDIEVLNHNKRYKEKRIKLLSDACGEMGQGLLPVMGPNSKTTISELLAAPFKCRKTTWTTGT